MTEPTPDLDAALAADAERVIDDACLWSRAAGLLPDDDEPDEPTAFREWLEDVS